MFKNRFFSMFTFVILVLALASLACGAANLPFLATETPTPTLTFTPSPTPSQTPSPTPTLTHTPTATPWPTGVKTEEQSDGTTTFVDYDNRYQLVLPVDWIVLPFDKGNLEVAINRLAEQNPELATAALAFERLDPNVMRVVAINSRREYITRGYASNITIAAIEDETLAAMPLSFITGVLEGSFQQQGMKVLTSGVNTIENRNGVEVEYLDVEHRLIGERVQQHVIVFQSNDKLIVITITTLPEFKNDIFPMGDQIGASIERLE